MKKYFDLIRPLFPPSEGKVSKDFGPYLPNGMSQRDAVTFTR
jgi:hypothetical protein